MDKHYLTPLFAPDSVVVFAGDPQQADAPTPMAGTLRRLLAEGGTFFLPGPTEVRAEVLEAILDEGM